MSPRQQCVLSGALYIITHRGYKVEMTVHRKETFGYIIRQAWERSGMTQLQFATKLGVRQPRVPQIFDCDNLTEAMFDRCIAALGLKLEIRIIR